MHNRPTPSLPRPALGDLSARANLSAARRRVLEVVEASNDAMTAVQVASALNLHHNTVREHLDALVDAGFVTVSTKPTGKRGRPALRYASTAPDPQQMVDAYLLLLDAIADTLGEGEDAHATALEIGRRWAELTPCTVAEPTVDGEQVDRVTALIPYLAVMGFAPEVSGDTVVLRSCPLITRNHQPRDLVCTMHEGFLRAVVGPDPAAYERLKFLPNGPDGCQINSAQPVHEEPDLKIVHADVA